MCAKNEAAVKIGDAKYDALVTSKLEANMHKVTTLTESECAQEVKDITENAFEGTTAAGSELVETPSGPIILIPLNESDKAWARAELERLHPSEPKRKRGRPPGSRNKPKVPKE